MALSEYSGSIYSDSIFKTDSRLIPIRESFILHWRNGFHPDFGRDTLFHKPPCVYPIHLRKVHVNLGLYTNNYGFNGTEECWSDWSTGRFGPGGYEKHIPTSDAYLIYAVCESRNAGLLDFWFPPAHEIVKSDASVELVAEMADTFYAKIAAKPMSREIEPWHSDFKIKKPA
jgi:hypothetical protein